MLRWRVYFQQLLVQNSTSVPLFILVLLVHYFCCTSVCKHEVGSTQSNASYVYNVHQIQTPLVYIYSKYFNTTPTVSIHTELPEAPVDTPIQREWGSLASSVRDDPFTFVYTSIQGLRFTEADTEDGSCKVDDSVPESPPPVVTAEIVFLPQPIFDMFGISILSFMIMWLPSIYTPFVCKASDVWLMGNTVLLIYFSSWTFCILTYAIGGMHRVAYCVAMHTCIQLQYKLFVLVLQSSDIPIPFSKLFASVLGVGVATILFYILHACGTNLSYFNSLDFYMSHMWAFILMEFMRAVPYRIITTLLL
jgi:hypothetical protein